MKQNKRRLNVLVIDVGGTNIKILATGRREPRKIPSGPAMTSRAMVKAVREHTADWLYDAISLGYPGPVRDGRPVAEPKNLGSGWVRFDFKKVPMTLPEIEAEAESVVVLEVPFPE